MFCGFSNRPTVRWRESAEAADLERAFAVIKLATEDRAELQVRRLCWWWDLVIDDCGASPGPFKRIESEIHILRNGACTFVANDWPTLLSWLREWEPDMVQYMSPRECEQHPHPTQSPARSKGKRR